MGVDSRTSAVSAEALSILQSLEAQPQNPQLLRELAGHYGDLGMFRWASEVIDLLVKRNAAKAEDYVALAYLAVHDKQLTEAMKYLKTAEDRGAAPERIAVLLIDVGLDQGRPQTVLAACQRLQRSTSDKAILQRPMAIAYYHLGKYAEALELFREHLAAHPDDGQSRTYLGDCLVRCNRAAEGEAALVRAMKERPEDGLPGVILARLYQRQKRLEQAKQMGQEVGRRARRRSLKARRLLQTTLQVRNGIQAIQAHRWDQALQQFQSLQYLDKRPALAYSWLVHRLAGNHRQAAQLVPSMSELAPPHEFVFEQALRLIEAGEAADVVALLAQQTLVLRPDWPVPRMVLAELARRGHNRSMDKMP